MPGEQAITEKPRPTFTIRKANTHDAFAIHALINAFADQEMMLHRSLGELYENIRDFFVVEEGGTVVGCAALHVSWKDIAELKSLAVANGCQGRGYGRLLVEACACEALSLGLSRVFALTYVPDLFVKLGFDVVDRADLPRKVWTECIRCPKFSNCGEIAVLTWVGPKESHLVMEHSPHRRFLLELTPAEQSVSTNGEERQP